MPLKRCGKDNAGWKYGDAGHCYIGKDAKKSAVKQALAVGEEKFTDMRQFDINRSVFMFDNFDQMTSESMITQLLALDQASDEPINIFINSYGGDVSSLFAILDTIENLSCQINTVCLGEADSCGAVLLSAGDFRYIGENSKTMIHVVSGFSFGKVHELEEQVKLAQDTNDRLVSILAKNMEQDFTKLKEMMKNDTWMNSMQSKDMGLVDFIMSKEAMESYIEVLVQDGFSNFPMYNTRTLDGIVTNFLAKDKKEGGASQHKSTKSTQGNSKGEKIMNKEELLAELKAKHGLDVQDMLTNSVQLQKTMTSLADENVLVKTENAKLTKEIVDMKEAQAKITMSNLLESLITDGKSTQVLNDSVYKDAFEALGFEKATAMAKALPVIAKQTQLGSSTDSIDGDDAEFAAINKLQKDQNISFSEAARQFYTARKEK